MPEADVTYEGDTEIIEINFTTAQDSPCIVDASTYGVDMADPTGVDTPQGNMEWWTSARSWYQNHPSPFHVANGVNSIYQQFIEIDPPVRSVSFYYATDVSNAWWGGELVADPDSMRVFAGSRAPGTTSYTWYDGVTLYKNIESFTSADTWDSVTLSAPWDAIGIVWFNGPAAIDNLTIIRSVPPGVACDTVVRGSVSTCDITREVDAVLGWTFRAELPHRGPGQSDTVTIAESTASTTWSGDAVLSGEVSARVVMNGGTDTVTLAGALAVLDRSTSRWRWDESDWLWTDSTSNAQCDYQPFYLPSDSTVENSGRLAVNRPTTGCPDALALSSIAPNENPKMAFASSDVQGGPNDGLHYLTSAGYYMDRTAEMNPFLASVSTDRLTLTDRADVRECQKQPQYSKSEPVVANYWEYNEICRQYSLADFYAAVWSHEGFGTQDSLDPAWANGHEARRWIGARQPENDPRQTLERMVNPDSAWLWAVASDSLAKIDGRLKEMADPDHLFVQDNYLDKNKCGYVWAMDTAQYAYTRHTLEIETPHGVECF